MKTVLLVDDDLVFSHHVADGLKHHGYDVDAVRTVNDAIENLQGKTYDAVVSDIIFTVDNRPVPSGGLSLIHWLRAKRLSDPDLARTPVIGISGAGKYPGMKSILNMAETVGADATLEKPLVIEDLVATIEDVTTRGDTAAEHAREG